MGVLNSKSLSHQPITVQCFPHSVRNACDRARGPLLEVLVSSRSARRSQVRGPTSPPRPPPPSAMAFVTCAPLRCRASTSNPGPRCFHSPRLRRLSARTLADRRPVMVSQTTADVPPAVVLLPGMDGTALLARQFRAALDPTTCLVVRFVSRFFLAIHAVHALLSVGLCHGALRACLVPPFFLSGVCFALGCACTDALVPRRPLLRACLLPC